MQVEDCEENHDFSEDKELVGELKKLKNGESYINKGIEPKIFRRNCKDQWRVPGSRELLAA